MHVSQNTIMKEVVELLVKSKIDAQIKMMKLPERNVVLKLMKECEEFCTV